MSMNLRSLISCQQLAASGSSSCWLAVSSVAHPVPPRCCQRHEDVMKGVNTLLKRFVFWGLRQKSNWSEHTVSLGRITLTWSLLLSLLKRQGNLCCPGSSCCVNVAKNSKETAFPSSSLRGCCSSVCGKVILVFSGGFLTEVCAVRLGPLCFPALWLKGSCSRHSNLLHPSGCACSWPC